MYCRAEIGEAVLVKIFIGEGIEIFLLKDFLQIRLLIEQSDFRLTEAVTLPAVNISGIMAVRAVIYRLQIIVRQSCPAQKLLFIPAQLVKLFF